MEETYVDSQGNNEPPVPYYTCNICNISLDNDEHLVSEHKTLHRETSLHKCDDCNKTFPSANALEAHMERNAKLLEKAEKRHKCDLCSKEFHSSRDLACHKTTHKFLNAALVMNNFQM